MNSTDYALAGGVITAVSFEQGLSKLECELTAKK